MPPTREQRKLAPVPPRGALVVPDFTEAGVLLAITYSIREGRRGEFFDLMRELKPLLSGIGGMDCTIYEDRSRLRRQVPQGPQDRRDLCPPGRHRRSGEERLQDLRASPLIV